MARHPKAVAALPISVPSPTLPPAWPSSYPVEIWLPYTIFLLFCHAEWTKKKPLKWCHSPLLLRLLPFVPGCMIFSGLTNLTRKTAQQCLWHDFWSLDGIGIIQALKRGIFHSCQAVSSCDTRLPPRTYVAMLVWPKLWGEVAKLKQNKAEKSMFLYNLCIWNRNSLLKFKRLYNTFCENVLGRCCMENKAGGKK